jgi:hypothetical protein
MEQQFTALRTEIAGLRAYLAGRLARTDASLGAAIARVIAGCVKRFVH